MTVKWPASQLLATSLSMVGAGRCPPLGVGGEMKCRSPCTWRVVKQNGPAPQTSSFREVRDVIFREGMLGNSLAFAKKQRRLLSEAESRRLNSLLDVKSNAGSFIRGTCVTGMPSFCPKKYQMSVDGTVWSVTSNHRCIRSAYSSKDFNPAGDGHRMSVGTFFTWTHRSAVSNRRESGGSKLVPSSLYVLNGRINGSLIAGYGAGGGKRRFSIFRDERLRWKRILKAFSQDVDPKEDLAKDPTSETYHKEYLVEPVIDCDVSREIVNGVNPVEIPHESRVAGTLEVQSELNGHISETMVGIAHTSDKPGGAGQTEQDGRTLGAGNRGTDESVSEKVANDVTVICFDIETTGLHPAYHKIIEFAARDLSGGPYSTMETLVNPDREIPLESERIHNISSKMVNNPDVPRWKDVALAIVRFVESRRKGDGPVLLVAHNGKRFDVPFILKEFRDCEVSVPSFLRFADSMPLARSAMKLLGQKRAKVALVDLFSHYNLEAVGDAHRAMADVNMLAPVLQMLMNDLSMGVQDLLEQSFSAEEFETGRTLQLNDLPSVEELYDGSKESTFELLDEQSNLKPLPETYEGVLEIGRSEEVEGISPTPSSLLAATRDDPPPVKEDVPSIMEEELERSIRLAIDGNQNNVYEESNLFKKSPSGLEGHHPARQDGDRIGEKESSQPFIGAASGGSQTLNNLEVISLDMGEVSREEDSEKLVSRSKDEYVHPEFESIESESGQDRNFSASDDSLMSSTLYEYETPLLTTTVDVSLLSPMMRQYVETKRQRDSRFLLLSQVGDFYEAFFEDADKLAQNCNLRLTAKDGGKVCMTVKAFRRARKSQVIALLLKRKIPMAGVPVQHIDKTLQTLLSKGISVVRQDQVCDEESTVTIERRVSAVLTPGTLIDGAMLQEGLNNFLVAIMPSSTDDGTWGLAYSDVSTGEFRATEVRGKEALVQELLRLQPAEVVLPAVSDDCIGVDPLIPTDLPSQFCYLTRPMSDFMNTEAEKKLEAHCEPVTSQAMSVLSFPRAAQAAGGLLGYVQETQQMCSKDLPLQKLRYYSTGDSMDVSETVRKHLEMTTTTRWGKSEGSFIWAVDDTRTAMGRRMLQKWLLRPLLQPKGIKDRQDAVEIFVNHLDARTALRSELQLLGDLERLTGRVGWKKANAREMLILSRSLLLLPNLVEIAKELPTNSYITALLKPPLVAVEVATRVQEMLCEEADVRFPGEVIKAGFDTSLDEIRSEVEGIYQLIEGYEKEEQERTGIASLEIGYTKPLGRFISIRKTRLKDLSLPEEYQPVQSLKSEQRFTTPILQTFEKLRLEALRKASEREEELFLELKEEMSQLLEPIQEYSKALAEVDILCNFAEIAVKWRYCRPQILMGGDRELRIVEGRHPVVERCLPDGVKFVPNSTYLGYAAEESNQGKTELSENTESSWPRPDIMVLTGPNASGKSCYLRQIGLIQILAQAGSFVPARECRLSITDGVYTRVGSVDDLAAGQSTFKVEMTESADILAKATPHSLILLDEVGRGTGSQEGEAIARATIEYLAQHVKARTVFSTHYHELHVLERELENVSNYYLKAVETTEGELLFDHTVRPGYALRSYAVGVARASGMPEWVCSRATALLADMAGKDASKPETTEVSIANDDRIGENSSSKLFEVQFESHQAEEFFEDSVLETILYGGTHRNARNGTTSGNRLDVSKVSKRGKSSPRRMSNLAEAGEVQSDHIQSLGGNEQSETPYARDKEFDGASPGTEGDTLLHPVEPTMTPSEDSRRSSEDLTATWNSVCAALNNRPATQALARQKGNLIAINSSSNNTRVQIGSSALFVRKFLQHEHASALEAAFSSVLKQPVKVDVTVQDSKAKKQ